MSSRDRILARRAKFIAAAIASAGAISCSDDASTTTLPQVCLEPAIDASASDSKADTMPMPCLEPAVDTGVADSATDTAVTDTGDVHDTAEPDTGPMPCLKMPPPDGG